MSEKDPFQEKIHTEKLKRLGPLLRESNAKVSQEEMVSFFEKRGIDPDSMRDFYKNVLGKDNQSIESALSLLRLNDGKEQIVADILAKGPFPNSEALTRAIAEYIRNKMKYDVFSFLNQLRQGVQEIDYRGESIDQSTFSLFLRSLNVSFSAQQEKFLREAKSNSHLSDVFFPVFTEKFEQQNQFVIDKSIMKLFGNSIFQSPMIEKLKSKYPILIILEKDIQSDDVSAFRSHFLQEYAKNDDFRGLMAGAEREMNWYSEQSEISHMLNEVHQGVCRHFGMIMREVYNEVNKQTKFHNTQMLYVGNFQHVYNVLLSEGKNGQIQKQYLDITDFLDGKDLFRRRPNMKDENEFWVNNSLSGRKFV